MNKTIVPVLIVALVLMLSIANNNVSAVATNPLVADGVWIGDGKAIPVDVTGTVYPAWLTLVNSTGFKVTESQQICHAFPGGQLGWVADIRVKSGNEWLAVPTTQGWEPDEEGTYMACADVNWGTHALFAYYVKPENTVAAVLPECDFSPRMLIVYHPASDWPGDPYTGYTFEAVLYDNPVPPGTAVSYEIIESVNLPSEIRTSASGTSEMVGDYDFIQTVVFYQLSAPPRLAWSATFRLTFPTCYAITYFGDGGGIE